MTPTQKKILELLKNAKTELKISEIATIIGVERHTAAKNLEALQANNLVRQRNEGKAKLWSLSKNPFLEMLKKNDPVSNHLKEILNSIENRVSIQSPEYEIIWHNKNSKKVKESFKCFEAFYGKTEKCMGCPVEKTFKTGKSASKLAGTSQIITTPIRDVNNKVIAVVEILKKNSE